MNLSDYLLIGVILLVLAGAICVCVRNHRQGKSCGCSCTHCDHSCGK